MALYYNGKMVAGVNSMPELTQAQYDALEVKPEFWIRTDAPDDYGRIPASDVGFDNSVLGVNSISVQSAFNDVNFDLIPKTTTFNDDGSISIEGEGFDKTVTFNADGSITEAVEIDGVTTTKTTSFIGSSIIESVSGGGES